MILYKKREGPFYIVRDSDFSCPIHVHREIEILFCTEGVLDVTCKDEPHCLHPGDIAMITPYTPHCYTAKHSWKGILFIVSPVEFTAFHDSFHDYSYQPVLRAPHEELFSLALSAFNEYETAKDDNVLTGYLYVILGKLLRELPHVRVIAPSETPWFSEVLQYVSTHYTQELSLADVAQKFGVTQSHLARTFRSKLSCTFLMYLHELRVEYAKILLRREQRMRMSEICDTCGFSNQRSFNRVFLQLVGINPSEYRKQYTTCSDLGIP